MGEPPPALHRAIIGVDVEGFGDERRTNPDQLAVREALYRCLREAFANAGIPWEDCYHEDRGDGALFLIPAYIPKKILGVSYLKLRQFHEAEERFHEALTCQRETGDRYGEAQTLRDLARLQRQLHDIIGARHSLRLAMSIFNDVGDPQLCEIEAEMEQLQG